MSNKQTILIVDDVKENVDVLVELLKNHDLVTALDGKTAIEIVEEENIDLILLDIMMPEMDGFEVCKRVKKNPKTLHIPILFLSAKDKHEDVQKGFELGAVDYITKPFNPNELLSRVNTHLKLRAYEKNLELRVEEELQKNRVKQQMIHQQSKQSALGELLMHIAHQWKQPLASLSSMNLVFRSKLEDNIEMSRDDLYKKVKRTDEIIDFMANTVDTFRDFYQPSHIDENFSLTDSVNRVLNISDATLRYHNIKISQISHEKSTTYGNANEFTQVIFSIINNASDIFKQRNIQNPEIYIEIDDQKISISDNGGGIESEMMDDIFLPFKSTTNGNGIGLFIAKEIVVKNSGVISAKNSEKGAIFHIEFLTWID